MSDDTLTAPTGRLSFDPELIRKYDLDPRGKVSDED